jgi:predicted NUDIX family phosphoesterase
MSIPEAYVVNESIPSGAYRINGQMVNTAPSEPRVKAKHQELIVAVDSEYFDSVGASLHHSKIMEVPFLHFITAASGKATLRQRALLEKDPQFRQLLPYIVARTFCVDGKTRYHPYKRLPGGGEVGLTNKISVGYGGHIDAEDVQWGPEKDFSSVINLAGTLIRSATREANEEMVIADATTGEKREAYDTLTFSDLFVINSDNPVCLVHAAVIMFVEIAVTEELTCAEKELEAMPAMTAEELIDLHDSGQFIMEPWSYYFLQHEIAAAKAV